ncbi:hypothetical protein SAMN05660443_0187 [Marinospirillum celere]|uniref:Uncharacterized protein n=1 Tax=Marinospirillum celere TaxID=1122252 RepID=A0A1I1E385_9GAMM|nr:hypothetical protein [Marinospirillum celere]SFB79678.1 hypothetical protein SAMN05660443_0187 [Marinospirillum celere]
MLVSDAKKNQILQTISQTRDLAEKATIFRIEMVHGSCTMLCPGGVDIEKAVVSALSRFGEDRVVTIQPQ